MNEPPTQTAGYLGGDAGRRGFTAAHPYRSLCTRGGHPGSTDRTLSAGASGSQAYFRFSGVPCAGGSQLCPMTRPLGTRADPPRSCGLAPCCPGLQRKEGSQGRTPAAEGLARGDTCPLPSQLSGQNGVRHTQATARNGERFPAAICTLTRNNET